VEKGSYTVRVGSQVRRGERLATARSCGMLHFELYQGRQTANQRWSPAGGRVTGAGCAANSLQTKPSALLDPRPLLRCIMPPGARFRGGTGFLNNGDLSMLDDDLEGDQSVELGAGEIVGIVIGMLVCIALVVAAAVFYRIRKASSGSAPAMSVPNQVYAQPSVPADLGHFTCDQCGKEYNYANDLAIHKSTRHGN
jgi:hypothetical protein